MNERTEKILEELLLRYPVLVRERANIEKAYGILKECYDGGGKLLIGGNGGSCADSGHIVGELMKGFVKKRPVPAEFAETLRRLDPKDGELLASTLQGALPAINITEHNALNTAYANDVSGGSTFAQQVYGYGKKGDVFLGISTSGNSRNVLQAVTVAKALGMKTIGLCGRDGGALKTAVDAAIVAPETETFKIQELHLPVYHALCLMLEETYFNV